MSLLTRNPLIPLLKCTTIFAGCRQDYRRAPAKLEQASFMQDKLTYNWKKHTMTRHGSNHPDLILVRH